MSVLSKFLVFSIFFCLLLEIWSFPSNNGAIGDSDDDNGNHTFLITGGYRPPGHLYAKHIVSIRTTQPMKYFGDNHFCGGSIISPRYILTAAHCIIYPANKLRVVIGTPHRLLRASSSRVLRVKNSVIHPRYAISPNANDIAILEMRYNILEDNDTVQRIALSVISPEPGTMCVAVGWGRLLSHGPLAADALYVNLELLSEERCKMSVFGWKPGMLCAADLLDFEKDTCNGDSGGPLICNNEVMGITSFGMECAYEGFAGVYTNVSFYQDWIQRTMKGSTGGDPKLFQSFCVYFSLLLSFVISEWRHSII